MGEITKKQRSYERCFFCYSILFVNPIVCPTGSTGDYFVILSFELEDGLCKYIDPSVFRAFYVVFRLDIQFFALVQNEFYISQSCIFFGKILITVSDVPG